MAAKNNDKNKKGLGRGLSALLGDYAENSIVPADSPSRVRVGSIAKVPLEAIETNPWQPRTSFEEEALQELSDSIRKQGLIQPITVRDMGNGKYQLISGERRVRASKMAGLTMIAAYVRTADDLQMMEMALVENLQREDLNPIEVAVSLQRLQEECGITQEDVAEKVGKSRSAVTNYLRLLKLGMPVQQALCDHRLSMGHARSLVVVEDAAEQQKLLDEILKQGLSVRQVEDRVRQLQQAATAQEKPKTALKVELPSHVKEAGRRLSGRLQTAVEIHRSLKGKGSLTIRFKSDEDFARIMKLLQE
ncbi:MAG: ParB/RepB/Spo0J family partition protein [Bacteroidales bacterium]|nr:ParB/RepB/Spo0J family partition protein [Bacteroidales bacterium]